MGSGNWSAKEISEAFYVVLRLGLNLEGGGGGASRGPRTKRPQQPCNRQHGRAHVAAWHDDRSFLWSFLERRIQIQILFKIEMYFIQILNFVKFKILWKTKNQKNHSNQWTKGKENPHKITEKKEENKKSKDPALTGCGPYPSACPRAEYRICPKRASIFLGD
jgi:hypothetical protein